MPLDLMSPSPQTTQTLTQAPTSTQTLTQQVRNENEQPATVPGATTYPGSTTYPYAGAGSLVILLGPVDYYPV